jgi:hypothetical protein
VTPPRQVEVELADWKTTPQARKEAESTAETYYRWREDFSGLKLDRAKRLKMLERERQAEAASGGAVFGEANSEGCGRGKPEGAKAGDRETAGGLQHEAPTLGGGLQAAFGL